MTRLILDPCDHNQVRQHSAGNLHCHLNHNHFHLSTNQDKVVKVIPPRSALPDAMSSMAAWLQTLCLQGQSADDVTCALTQSFSGAVGNHAREDPHHRNSDKDPKDSTESRADEAQSGLGHWATSRMRGTTHWKILRFCEIFSTRER